MTWGEAQEKIEGNPCFLCLHHKQRSFHGDNQEQEATLHEAYSLQQMWQGHQQAKRNEETQDSLFCQVRKGEKNR